MEPKMQCRYVMLAVIVGHQMNLDPERLQKVQELGPHVALYFLACPLAAYNDLLFIQQIRALRRTQETIAEAVLESLKGQVWYLDAPWVVCALVDKRVAVEEKKKIATTLHSFPQSQHYPPTPAKPLLPKLAVHEDSF